jgi:hypothetical protein
MVVDTVISELIVALYAISGIYARAYLFFILFQPVTMKPPTIGAILNLSLKNDFSYCKKIVI